MHLEEDDTLELQVETSTQSYEDEQEMNNKVSDYAVKVKQEKP